MPLLNMMFVCGDANSTVVSICDCTDLMSEGGKKDSTYIAKMFQEKLHEFDPDRKNTGVFFFDEASNMQKAGQILCQNFRRSYCFHGREHVLSLFFSDLSKLKPIKVRYFYLSCFK